MMATEPRVEIKEAGGSGGGAGEGAGPFRVRLSVTKRFGGRGAGEMLAIGVCGAVRAREGKEEADLVLRLYDISSGGGKRAAVLRASGSSGSLGRQRRQGYCEVIRYGTVGQRWQGTGEWDLVAVVPTGELEPARQGLRTLELTAEVVGRTRGEVLARAAGTCLYHHAGEGYLDRQERQRRVRQLTVGLAEATARLDGAGGAAGRAVIKAWRQKAEATGKGTEKGKSRRLGQWVSEAIEAVRGRYGRGDVREMCRELAALGDRADAVRALRLCLRVAGADGWAGAGELEALRAIAGWLEIDGERFRRMLERYVPVTMHETRDTELLLGISEETDEETRRRRLCQEYSKWNARAIHPEREVRCQAEVMLELIAEMRAAGRRSRYGRYGARGSTGAAKG